MSSKELARHLAVAGIAAALALIATGCPEEPPGPVSPFHPAALAPGNRIHVVQAKDDPANFSIANPGGVTPFPSDPDAASKLFWDTEGLGDPTSNLRIAPVTTVSFHVGVFDGTTLVQDLGPGSLGGTFSGDGSTLAVAHQFVAATDITIYNTSDLSIRRTIDWDAATLGQPVVLDVSRDGSKVLLAGSATPPPGDVPGLPLYVASTSGTDAPILAVPNVPSGQIRFVPRLTNGGRLAYFARIDGPTSTWELRTAALDGSDARTVTSFDAFGTSPGLAAEIGTGRLIVQIPVVGSTTLSDIVVMNDAVGAARTLVASNQDISSGLKGLTRLVTPA